jgi:glutaredoxin
MISRGIFLVLLCAATLAHAQLYRWVDEKGRVHYTETPPPPSAKGVEKKRDHMGARADPGLPFELQRAVRNAPVTLYSHPDCKSPCQMARDVLNRRGVPFKETVVADEKLLEELKRISGGDEVPVLVVGRHIEKTISSEAYHSALDVAGYPKEGSVPPRAQAAPPPPRSEPERPAAAKDAAKPAAEEPAPPAGPYAPRFSK